MSTESLNSNNQKYKVKDFLEVLIPYYRLDVDLEGLVHEIPQRSKEPLLVYLCRLLDKLAFDVVLEKAADYRVHQKNICIVAHNNELMAMVPTKGGEQKTKIISANEQAVKTLEPEKLTFADMVVVRGRKTLFDAYTKHMKKGHALDWFIEPIKQYSGKYYEVLVSSFFINLLVLSIPLFTLNVYDRVIVNFAEETLIVLTVGVFVALAFDFIFKTVRAYILEKVTEDLGNEYDFMLLERLINIKAQGEVGTVGRQANMFRELNSIREFYAGRLVPNIVDLPFALLFILIIYLLAPALALVPIVIITVILLANYWMHVPISRMTEDYFNAMQNKSSVLFETLAGLQTIKMFGASYHRLFEWNTSIAKAARSQRINNFITTLVSNFTFTATQISHVSIIFFGVYQIQQADLTIGGLITCSILSSRAIAPIMNFSSLLGRLQQTNDVLKAIDKVFEVPSESQDAILKSAKGPFSGALTLRNVTFQYPIQNRPALNQVSLEIAAGESLGLIGKTAAGKTTLAKLISGLIEPQEGEIKLDAFDFSAIAPTELRRTIAYAPQDSFFFQGSVLYNVTLGRDDISKEDIEEAAELSGLNLVLKNNGEGLDMEVGEQGGRLSGGQKQAISLARAMIKKPKVMIFDEPTTGMDTTLETHVLKCLHSYIKDKTFIMITHRTSMLPLVKRLVLVDSGRVVADGPKDEILSKLGGRQ